MKLEIHPLSLGHIRKLQKQSLAEEEELCSTHLRVWASLHHPGSRSSAAVSLPLSAAHTPTHKESSGWEVARTERFPLHRSFAAPRVTNSPAPALELGFTSLFSTWTMILDDVT